jgi:pectate lyase
VVEQWKSSGEASLRGKVSSKLSPTFEDAITLKGIGSVLIQGGGAQNAKDKVVQHKGKGTVTIKHYTVVNVGKLFRSCGNCSKNGGPRNVVVSNVKANRVTADLVDINSNYGDVASISGSCGKGVKNICQEFKGVLKSEGIESPKLTSTANCKGAQANLKALPTC